LIMPQPGEHFELNLTVPRILSALVDEEAPLPIQTLIDNDPDGIVR